MPVEWVVTGLVAIISTLAGAVALLWRNHLAADERERARGDRLQKRLDDVVDVLKKAAPKP